MERKETSGFDMEALVRESYRDLSTGTFPKCFRCGDRGAYGMGSESSVPCHCRAGDPWREARHG